MSLSFPEILTRQAMKGITSHLDTGAGVGMEALVVSKEAPTSEPGLIPSSVKDGDRWGRSSSTVSSTRAGIIQRGELRLNVIVAALVNHISSYPSPWVISSHNNIWLDQIVCFSQLNISKCDRDRNLVSLYVWGFSLGTLRPCKGRNSGKREQAEVSSCTRVPVPASCPITADVNDSRQKSKEQSS